MTNREQAVEVIRAAIEDAAVRYDGVFATSHRYRDHTKLVLAALEAANLVVIERGSVPDWMEQAGTTEVVVSPNKQWWAERAERIGMEYEPTSADFDRALVPVYVIDSQS